MNPSGSNQFSGHHSNVGASVNRPPRSPITWALRVVALVAFSVAIGLAVHRFRRSPEQKELTHYVEAELPGVMHMEEPVLAEIERLNRAPGLSPPEARMLLIDKVIPELVRIKKSLDGFSPQTIEVRELHEEYKQVIEQLINACRTSVRVIDDPKLTTQTGAKQVADEFARARDTRKTWQLHVAAACKRNRLLAPTSEGPHS